MGDPLDFLNDLPDWPGNTPPRNRGGSKRRPAIDILNGARSRVYRINGKDMEMFTVGELARALGKKPGTIRMWELNGWIPRANFRTPSPLSGQLPNTTPRGRRLYTREQVEFLVEAADRFKVDDKVHGNWHKFKAHIKANWPK